MKNSIGVKRDTRKLNFKLVRGRFKSGKNHGVKYVGAKPR